MEEFEKQLKGKTRLLEVISEETNEVLEKKEKEAVTRHIGVYEKKVREICELKLDIQELKLAEGQDPGEVRAWAKETQTKIKEFDAVIAKLKDTLSEIHRKERSGEEKLVLMSKQKLFEQEKEFERVKFEERIKQERKLEEIKGPTQSTNAKTELAKVKLPKLVISKFQGTHIDWIRFWNQFKADIDNSSIDPVAKFSYLKELLLPKVRVHIDGLPFSTEGYERAKNILKSTYGKDSEVVNAYVQNITSLPVIRGNYPNKIHEFYAKLLTSVQALESMGKLAEINGLTRATLDKLEGIKSILVLLDKTWQDWKFPNLVEALKDWMQRNPINPDHRGASANYFNGNSIRQIRRENSFQAKQSEWKSKPCVYYEDLDHKSSDCIKVKEIAERREVLRKKKRCFNCTGGNHHAAECRVRTGCLNCGANHHSSICNKKSTEQQALLTTNEQGIVYPVVLVKVNGVKCRALLDTGASNSYISSKLIEILNQRPIAREYRRIDMMMCTTTRDD